MDQDCWLVVSSMLYACINAQGVINQALNDDCSNREYWLQLLIVLYHVYTLKVLVNMGKPQGGLIRIFPQVFSIHAQSLGQHERI